MTDSSTAGLAVGLPMSAMASLWFLTVLWEPFYGFAVFITEFAPLVWLLPDEIVWLLETTTGIALFAILAGVTVGATVGLAVKAGVILVRGVFE